MRGTGAERPVRAMKSRKLDGAKGSRHPAYPDGQPRAREEPSIHAKSFRISKWSDGPCGNTKGYGDVVVEPATGSAALLVASPGCSPTGICSG